MNRITEGGKMFRKFIVIIGLSILVGSISAYAQEEPKWGLNVGGGVGIPVASTGVYVGNGGNYVIGGGYKFGEIIQANGEFMWQGLPVNFDNRAAISAVTAGSDLYSLTGNLMLKTPGTRKFGGYVIGGGGWYRLKTSLNRASIPPGQPCGREWNWWVTSCVNGFVPVDAVGIQRDDVFGANVGGGVTYRVIEGGMKIYAEARFHYAPTNPVFTRVIPVTIGVRW
jgi:Outer membrane protein beta-barrel domain